MELLVCLARNAGRAVSKESIYDAAWHKHAVGEGVLRRTVAILRRALGDDARNPTYIETIPKRGYCLIAPVSWPGEHEHFGATDTIDRASRFVLPGEIHDARSDGETRTPLECSLEFGDHGFPLREVVNLIGRSSQASVRLDCDRVSRRHAQIIIAGGLAFIEDLGSRNGTSVRGRRMYKPTQLGDGEEIGIGSFLMVFRSHFGWDSETDLYTEADGPGDETRDLHG
jgi:hypothetical protein